MKKIENLLAALALTFAFFQSSAQITRDSLANKVDQLLNDAASKGIFSGTVAIAQNGSEIYKRQTGFADWTTKRPFTNNTLFNMGSLTKQFTEEMIRQLIKENKLAYDAPLSKYLDIFPVATGNKITIQQLLEMRSGLGDYFASPEFRRIEQTDFKLSDLLNIIKQQPLLFEPGTSQQYSNSGYAVLGAVIEKVTGKTYENDLKERIAVPLGLKNLYYTKAEKAARPDRAFGNMINMDGNKVGADDVSNAQPAGGVYTNVQDMLAFAEAKGAGQLPSGYNYPMPGTFAGGTPLWNSVISFGNNGISYVVMSNIGESADPIARRIGAILKGENYPPLTTPFVVTLYQTLKEKGIDYLGQHIKEFCALDHKPYGDQFLNFYGYQFMQNGRTDMAIELFKLNVKLFPGVANGYDSLGEAYLKNGDKENARKNYNKELEIDPTNQQAKEIIKQIGN